MLKTRFLAAAVLPLLMAPFQSAAASEPCSVAGPQSGRDVGSRAGTNEKSFAMAPASETMNLCNIHFHRSAEHKAEGYSTFVGEGKHGGYACNGSAAPAAAGKAHDAAMEADEKGPAGCLGIAPGDTVEVHWVYTTCDTGPGEGLGNCVSCPEKGRSLRVEARVFSLGRDGLDFAAFDYLPDSSPAQPKALPEPHAPVAYLGSTTGTSFDDETCSPFQVTWNVSTACSPLKISTLDLWCRKDGEVNNVFGEDHAHGVRPLVTDPKHLSPIGQGR